MRCGESCNFGWVWMMGLDFLFPEDEDPFAPLARVDVS